METMSRRRLMQLLGYGSLALAAESASGQAGGIGLSTRLTREYGLTYPFVGAGMGFVAMPELVAAVTNAGGLGVLGNAIEPPPSTQILIQQIKALTTGPFGVDYFLANSAFGPATVDGHIDVAIAERVDPVVFHFDIPPRAWVDRLHAASLRVWRRSRRSTTRGRPWAWGSMPSSPRGPRPAGTTRARPP